MKTAKSKKNISTISTMLEVKDQFSKEIMNMTFEEEKAYLKKLLQKKATTIKKLKKPKTKVA